MRIPLSVDVLLAPVMADFTLYLWCTVIHRKHHKWTGDYRRDCLKCRSWYVWPEKYKKAMTVAMDEIADLNPDRVEYEWAREKIAEGVPLSIIRLTLENVRRRQMCVPLVQLDNCQLLGPNNEWPEVIE